MTSENSETPSHRSHGRREYSSGAAARQDRASARWSSRTIRLAFFAVAAFWGFSAGVAGLVAGLNLVGSPADMGADVILSLLVAGAIAVGGAIVIAGAYQEAKRRRRD